MTDLELKEVLAWVNEIRGQLGLKPVKKFRKGTPFNSTSCPLANTIQGKSSSTIVHVNRTSYKVLKATVKERNTFYGNLPSVARKFVKKVDSGHFPELEL